MKARYVRHPFVGVFRLYIFRCLFIHWNTQPSSSLFVCVLVVTLVTTTVTLSFEGKISPRSRNAVLGLALGGS